MRNTTLQRGIGRSRGSALVAVFFMIAILGMVMYAGAKALDADAKHSNARRHILKRRYHWKWPSSR
jgi:hypothetical protein